MTSRARAVEPEQSASEDASEDDADKPFNGLYTDEADRAKLEAMTELEREFELAERAEKRDRERERKRLLKQVQKGADQVGWL